MNFIDPTRSGVAERCAETRAARAKRFARRLSGSRRVRAWALLVSAIVAALVLHAALPQVEFLGRLGVGYPALTVLAIFLAALVCEFMDSSLGMGYGTTLSPLLILCDFRLADIVPAVLLSECLTGFAAGLLHHRDGNVDFVRDGRARRVLCWLVLLSAAGAILAVTIVTRTSEYWLRALVGTIILLVGVVILLTARRRLAYRPAQLLAVGAVAAFNKALSGGGYGPLVTGGQVVSGVSPRQAVAISSSAEFITCLIGLCAYMYIGGGINWSLAGPLVLGALLSVPLATLAVRRLPERMLRYTVGAVACLLGIATLMKMQT